MSEEVDDNLVLSSPPDKVRHWTMLRRMSLASFIAAIFLFPAAVIAYPGIEVVSTPFYFTAVSIIFLWATGETIDNHLLSIFRK